MSSFVYKFIHTEWIDTCILSNNKINRMLVNNEHGTYTIKDNMIIVKWFNWDGEDIFIEKNSNYYQKKFYDKYIINHNLIEKFFIHNEWEEACFLIEDLKLIFKKDNIKEFGKYEYVDNNIDINWNNWGKEFFILFNNIYYQKSYYDKHFNKNNKNNIKLFDKFKLINNKYYFVDFVDTLNNNNNIEIKEDIINNKKYIHHIIKDNLSIQDIKINLKKLLNSDLLNNKNYLDKNNINLFLNDNITLYDDMNCYKYIELDFEILPKTKKRCLSLVEWGFPPFGGGENWTLNINKLLFKNNYENYLICFSDPFKNEYFEKTNYIDLGYVKIIQMKKSIKDIIIMIKLINPDLINHQGVDRILYMKISNILHIPFLTGFCFWQNIFQFNMDNINVKILDNNNLLPTNDFEFIYNNSYTYSSSQFVNEVIEKFYNKKLDIIETISLKDDYLLTETSLDKKIFVTLINCHFNKGGYLIEYLCKNLDPNIPLLFVYTENDPIINIDYINNLLNIRNKIKNINLLIPNKVNIKDIYNKTRIILTPSLCDETFCRVGYEAMMNNIPVLSTKNGNLKYLLNNYAIFIDDYNYNEWVNQIQSIYNNNDIIKSFSNKNKNSLDDDLIELKLLNKIDSIKHSKYKLIDNHIGLIVPWADQGLGIQARDYYKSLKEIGYVPHIFSFRPYNATHIDLYLQSNKEEWNYDNVYYSSNYREDINFDEIFEFVYKYNIKKIIIIEATYLNIFHIAYFLKTIGLNIYLVANIECIRLPELLYHNVFDKILTNNIESHIILSNIFKYNTEILNFHLNHEYFDNISIKKNDYNIIKFFSIGGLNSLTRKNIILTIETFNDIYKDKLNLNWELNIYIQGAEIPDIIKNIQCPNIIYHIKHLSYKEIIHCYQNYHIFIHLGSHEGLGLGFFESIYCGTPILTLNWTPNNEIITNNINGWIINCNYDRCYDNDISLINRAIINYQDLKNKIIEILYDKNNTIKIIENTFNNISKIKSKNKYIFHRNLKNSLS
jgi:hypothetical protein